MAQEAKFKKGIYGAVSDTNIFIGSEKKQNQVVVWGDLSGYNFTSSGSDAPNIESYVAIQTTCVKASNSAAISASNAQIAKNAAEAAQQYAENAAASIPTYIGQKFWFGTAEEYNALTEIYADTFYFIKMGD